VSTTFVGCAPGFADAAGRQLERVASKRAGRRADRLLESDEVVAALEQKADPAVAGALGLRDDRARHGRVRRGVELHLGERIARVRVVSGRHEHDVGLEPLEEREHDPPERQAVALRPGPGRQRQVRGPAPTRAGADLAGRARARIERPLMERDQEDARIALERVLRPVAVVDVPVDDRDSPGAGGARRASRDRDVVQHAEPHRALGRRVVPWRSNQRERAGRRRRHEVARDGRAGPGGRPRGFPRSAGEVRVRVEIPVASAVQLFLKARQIAGGVDARELVGQGGDRREGGPLGGGERGVEAFPRGIEPLRPLRMVASGAVTTEPLVVYDSDPGLAPTRWFSTHP